MLKLVAITHFNPRTYPLSSPHIIANKMGRLLPVTLTEKVGEIPYTRQQLKQTFMNYDTNKDGQLSFDELKSAFEYLKSQFPGIRTELAFRKCDKDENGYIDYGKEMDSLVAYAEKCGFTIT